MSEAAPDPHAAPVWARDTAFPEALNGWGWVGPKNDRHTCASMQELIEAVSSDDSSRICLVWTPEIPRMVLPEEIPALNEAVNRSRAKWIGADLSDYTARLWRSLAFFSVLFGWVFYRQFSLASGGSSAGFSDAFRTALKRTLNESVIEIGFLLLVMFVLIPWYQARKRHLEMAKSATPAGLAEALPTMRFEIWLERQKAPLTWIFLGLMGIVGIVQLLPGDAISSAGLVKPAYRGGEWWRLFTCRSFTEIRFTSR